MGVMLSAAGSLRWYRDTLTPGVDFDTLLAPAAEVAPGSEGLLFLPYLTGERCPHPDPLARGAFVGLTVRHTQAHLTRALLEGVAFGLRDSFTLMSEAGLADVRQVSMKRLTGKPSRSWPTCLTPSWRRSTPQRARPMARHSWQLPEPACGVGLRGDDPHHRQHCTRWGKRCVPRGLCAVPGSVSGPAPHLSGHRADDEWMTALPPAQAL